jgi:hypothetical protein
MKSESPGRVAEEHPGKDRLIDLIMGHLPPVDESACLSHLRQCGKCERTARVLASELAKFRSMAHASPEMDKPAEAETKESTAILKHGDRNWWKRRSWWFSPGPAWAIPVAAVALMILVFVQREGRRMAGAIEPMWLVNPSSLIVTGRDSAVPALDPDLSTGFEAYARHDLDSAIRSLGRARAETDLEQLRRVYLGNALARKGRPLEAVRILRTIDMDGIPANLRSESRWTLFVALSDAGRASSAESLLTLLGREPGEVGDRARQRLPSP